MKPFTVDCILGVDFRVVDMNRARVRGVTVPPPGGLPQFNIAISYRPLRLDTS